MNRRMLEGWWRWKEILQVGQGRIEVRCWWLVIRLGAGQVEPRAHGVEA